MSKALRAVVARYRQEPSPRPDGATHARDDVGITHAMEFVKSSCGRQISFWDGLTTLEGLARSGCGAIMPTWDEVDCMACVAARTT